MMINFLPRHRNDEIQFGGRRHQDSYSKYLAPAKVRLGAGRQKIYLFIYLSNGTEVERVH